MSSKLLYNVRSLAVKGSVMTSCLSDVSISNSGIISGQQILQFKYRPTLCLVCFLLWGSPAFLPNEDALWNLLVRGVSDEM